MVADVQIEHDVLTTSEAAAFLRASVRTVRRWANEGRLPSYRVGTARRFRRSQLLRWIEEQEGRAPVTSSRLAALVQR